jgi:hypothetical protein
VSWRLVFVCPVGSATPTAYKRAREHDARDRSCATLRIAQCTGVAERRVNGSRRCSTFSPIDPRLLRVRVTTACAMSSSSRSTRRGERFCFVHAVSRASSARTFATTGHKRSVTRARRADRSAGRASHAAHACIRATRELITRSPTTVPIDLKPRVMRVMFACAMSSSLCPRPLANQYQLCTRYARTNSSRTFTTT